MTKYQCLNCNGLDIDHDCIAVCTHTYEPDALKNSVTRGVDCSYFRKQEERE